jgi:hypothetical protein
LNQRLDEATNQMIWGDPSDGKQGAVMWQAVLSSADAEAVKHVGTRPFRTKLFIAAYFVSVIAATGGWIMFLGWQLLRLISAFD